MTNTKEILLEAKNISHGYPGVTPTFENLSFDLYKNEIFCLLGPSGCGKSTFLQCLTGFEQPYAGDIFFKGQNLRHIAPEKRGFGLVFQDYSLFPHLTISQNISYGLMSQPSDFKNERVQQLLTLLNLLGHENKYPFELSGGEQQRVAIARAMAPAPELILFDEPFSNLDPALRENLRLEVKDLLIETQTSAIFITHDQEEAFDLGDRIGVLYDGKIQQVGTPDDIYHRPETEFIASFLGSNHFIEGQFHEGVLQTLYGKFDIKSPAGPEEKVRLYVPHANIKLNQPGPGVSAKVLRRYFRGESYWYDVRVDTTSQEFTHIPESSPLDVGDEVSVHIKKEGLSITFPIKKN